ncbi:MAG TPA: hypothetical protein VGU61_02170 [Noviherbaspirillum sp.]|jgi:hypothetical protein|uniref:hypothetical protein n=1 Tax=Noviherbaspirillum sp. TaxID=1926288 RepID=UPI002DDCD67F|nr:hypothetical protein [Noviherbaspirillum sp.]HEV2609047.1 hypothetical protein [Noviherbaspirillum sp.]
MSFDQQEAMVICISPGINDRWDVSEKGFEEPLASFDEKEDAYAYATELSRTKEGSTVLVEDGETFLPLSTVIDAETGPDARTSSIAG